MQAQPTFEAQPQPLLRPVRPEDRAAMRRFVQALGPESRGLRFHGGVKPDSDRLLSHLTQADGGRHIAFVAVLACDDGELIVGEARAVRGSADEPAEFAIAVADAWQGRGLARQLLRTLLAAAAEAGFTAVAGEVLMHNARMGGFMQREGFVVAGASEAGVQRWQRTLVAPQPRRPGWLAWLGGQFGVGRALHAA
jgi:acetyltransferase